MSLLLDYIKEAGLGGDTQLNAIPGSEVTGLGGYTEMNAPSRWAGLANIYNKSYYSPAWWNNKKELWTQRKGLQKDWLSPEDRTLRGLQKPHSGGKSRDGFSPLDRLIVNPGHREGQSYVGLGGYGGSGVRDQFLGAAATVATPFAPGIGARFGLKYGIPKVMLGKLLPAGMTGLGAYGSLKDTGKYYLDQISKHTGVNKEQIRSSSKAGIKSILPEKRPTLKELGQYKDVFFDSAVPTLKDTKLDRGIQQTALGNILDPFVQPKGGWMDIARVATLLPRLASRGVGRFSKYRGKKNIEEYFKDQLGGGIDAESLGELFGDPGKHSRMYRSYAKALEENPEVKERIRSKIDDLGTQASKSKFLEEVDTDKLPRHISNLALLELFKNKGKLQAATIEKSKEQVKGMSEEALKNYIETFFNKDKEEIASK